MKDHAAKGVKVHSGEEFLSKVVVSNANPFDTLGKMTDDQTYLAKYLDQLNHYSVSLSRFQIFLGLKEDLVGKVGIKDTEIFYETGYDMEAGYEATLKSELSNPGYALSLYDNLFSGYSPVGKNTLNILTLSSYNHWKQYEADYFAGNKDAYKKEKERIADILIDRVERTLLPGLRDAIEVKEIGTPLTNMRYTSNYHGAIYGLDQTVDNSGQSRLPHHTPISNLVSCRRVDKTRTWLRRRPVERARMFRRNNAEVVSTLRTKCSIVKVCSGQPVGRSYY